jgi:hypothetical protein
MLRSTLSVLAGAPDSTLLVLYQRANSGPLIEGGGAGQGWPIGCSRGDCCPGANRGVYMSHDTGY